MNAPDEAHWRPVVTDWLFDLLPEDPNSPGYLYLGTKPHLHYAAQLFQRWGVVTVAGLNAKRLNPPIGVQFNARWDDVCHLVLICMEKSRLILYPPLAPEVRVALAESYDVSEEDLDPEIPQEVWLDVAATRYCSAGRIHPQHLGVLQELGLIKNGEWTDRAVPVLWKKWASHHDYGMPGKTALFQDVLWEHAAVMQQDVAEQIEAHLTFPDALIARMKDRVADPDNPAEVLERASQSALLDLEGLFQERWRFLDGWLTEAERLDCLNLGFDPLADEMAREVVLALYPHSDLASSLSLHDRAARLLH